LPESRDRAVGGVARIGRSGTTAGSGMGAWSRMQGKGPRGPPATRGSVAGSGRGLCGVSSSSLRPRCGWAWAIGVFRCLFVVGLRIPPRRPPDGGWLAVQWIAPGAALGPGALAGHLPPLQAAGIPGPARAAVAAL